MSPLSSKDQEDIKRLHQRWLDEERAGRGSRVLELCVDDVLWLPPSSPPLRGKSAIAKWLRSQEFGLVALEVGEPEIRGHNRLAYLTSTYRSRVSLGSGLEAEEARGQHLWILDKAPDRSWRVVLVSWTVWGSDLAGE